MNSERLTPPAYLKEYPPELVYKDGWPVSYKLAENVRDLNARVTNGKAAMIVIDGGVGEGKTTLGVMLADTIQGSPIDLEKQVGMGGKNFLKQAEQCYEKRLPVIVYDEAGDFNRRGALKQFNAMINRFFETYRAYKIIVIVCVPDFGVLDRQLLNNKIPRLLLHLHGRTLKQGNFRAYSLYRMFWLLENMKKMPVKDKAFQRVQPNFYGHFKNLPLARREKLAELSTGSKKEILHNSRMTMEGFVSTNDLVRKLGKAQVTVSGKLRQLGIDPAEISGHMHYYPTEVVKTLEQAFRKPRTRRPSPVKP